MFDCNDIEKLKRDFPLLDYLKRFNWTPRRVGSGQEYVGLCLLHSETHPSFYVNAAKDLFYCHGCGYGGDLICFVQIYSNLSFQDSVAHLAKESAQIADDRDLLGDTVAFYQYQLQRHEEARWTTSTSGGSGTPGSSVNWALVMPLVAACAGICCLSAATGLISS